MKPVTEYIADGKIFHGEIPHVMGTRLEMLVVGMEEENVMALWERLHDLVFRLDRMLNRFDPESEVSVINLSDNPDQMPKSAALEEVVSLAERYNERTSGLFDVTDGNGKYDFGGFGKGYFLKKCEAEMRSSGVECAFVDFGNSSILCIGHHPYGDAWPIGIVDPYTRMTVKDILLADASVSTSGNTPKYNGHIRNPLTGEVSRGRHLVTVVADDPLDVEVLSTVLMIAPEDIRQSLMSEFPEARIEIMKCINQ